MKRKYKIKLPNKVYVALLKTFNVSEALKKVSTPFSSECQCTEITLAYVGCQCPWDAEVEQLEEVGEAIVELQILLNDALNLIYSHCRRRL